MPISQIKIYGERNSGTNYLDSLIRLNYCNFKILDNHFVGSGGTGWKHGMPFTNGFDTKSTLIVILFRDLNEWLISMYHNSYHLRSIPTFGTGDFNTFITTKFYGLEYNMFEYYKNYHPTEQDKFGFDFERNKDLFQIRYSKYKEYMKLTETNNVALINLDYLQKNPENVLIELDNKFGIFKYRANKPFVNYEKHTKTDENQQKRVYDKTILNQSFVDQHKNSEIEDHINSLTITCYINN